MPQVAELFPQPLSLPAHQKVYFVSDFHLGSPDIAASRLREDKIIRWLEMVQQDAHSVFLLGDTFDFWFEYEHVVPQGYVRFLGKLAELSDRGIHLYLFTGNHDMWMFDYFPRELSVPVIRQPISLQINQHWFHVGHGDGLGAGDRFYKFIKNFFTSRFCQSLFAKVHPDWGIALAQAWSTRSRRANLRKDESFHTKEDEWIYQYCTEVERQQHHDYYIFGHRHLVLDLSLGASSRYINTGEWFSVCHYAYYTGKQLKLVPFEASSPTIKAIKQ